MSGYTATWEARPDIGRHSIGNDIELVTRHFPTYGHWKAIVDGPDDLIRELGRSEYTFDDERHAQDGHARLVCRINEWYFASVAA